MRHIWRVGQDCVPAMQKARESAFPAEPEREIAICVGSWFRVPGQPHIPMAPSCRACSSESHEGEAKRRRAWLSLIGSPQSSGRSSATEESTKKPEPTSSTESVRSVRRASLLVDWSASASRLPYAVVLLIWPPPVRPYLPKSAPNAIVGDSQNVSITHPNRNAPIPEEPQNQRLKVLVFEGTRQNSTKSHRPVQS